LKTADFVSVEDSDDDFHPKQKKQPKPTSSKPDSRRGQAEAKPLQKKTPSVSQKVKETVIEHWTIKPLYSGNGINILGTTL